MCIYPQAEIICFNSFFLFKNIMNAFSVVHERINGVPRKHYWLDLPICFVLFFGFDLNPSKFSLG